MTLKGGFTGKITEFFLDFFFFNSGAPLKITSFLVPQKTVFFQSWKNKRVFLGTQKLVILGGGLHLKKSPCTRF